MLSRNLSSSTRSRAQDEWSPTRWRWAAILGLLGGAIGASVGLTAVALVAVTQQWTAVIQPWTVILAPLVGAAVGLLAGLYPAVRASRIEPIEAFKR